MKLRIIKFCFSICLFICSCLCLFKKMFSFYCCVFIIVNEFLSRFFNFLSPMFCFPCFQLFTVLCGILFNLLLLPIMLIFISSHFSFFGAHRNEISNRIEKIDVLFDTTKLRGSLLDFVGRGAVAHIAALANNSVRTLRLIDTSRLLILCLCSHETFCFIAAAALFDYCLLLVYPLSLFL